MALLQLTVIPLGTGTTSVADYVADIHKVLATTSISYKLNDMGTLLEGDIDQLLAVVRQLYDIPFASGAQRVVTQIAIDDRRDKEVRIGDKISSVEQLI